MTIDEANRAYKKVLFQRLAAVAVLGLLWLYFG